MAEITTAEAAKILLEILPKICVPGKWNVKGREYFGVDGNGKDIPDAPPRVAIELVHVPTGYEYRDFIIPCLIPPETSKKRIKESILAFAARLHHLKPQIEKAAWAWWQEKKTRGFTDQGMTDLTKRTGVKSEA